jgi:hypothetical protein
LGPRILWKYVCVRAPADDVLTQPAQRILHVGQLPRSTTCNIHHTDDNPLHRGVAPTILVDEVQPQLLSRQDLQPKSSALVIVPRSRSVARPGIMKQFARVSGLSCRRMQRVSGTLIPLSLGITTNNVRDCREIDRLILPRHVSCVEMRHHRTIRERLVVDRIWDRNPLKIDDREGDVPRNIDYLEKRVPP